MRHCNLKPLVTAASQDNEMSHVFEKKELLTNTKTNARDDKVTSCT